jgi:hypothetical protein
MLQSAETFNIRGFERIQCLSLVRRRMRVRVSYEMREGEVARINLRTHVSLASQVKQRLMLVDWIPSAKTPVPSRARYLTPAFGNRQRSIGRMVMMVMAADMETCDCTHVISARWQNEQTMALKTHKVVYDSLEPCTMLLEIINSFLHLNEPCTPL